MHHIHYSTRLPVGRGALRNDLFFPRENIVSSSRLHRLCYLARSCSFKFLTLPYSLLFQEVDDGFRIGVV